MRHGVDVFLADSVEEFAAAVVKVLQDRSLADRLGREAARIVRAQFGWDRVSAQFLASCLDAHAIAVA